ncbi:MAG: hypothetical protein MMC33_004650 [Icmadophila ericetorum]|nr:hypothetical protein [Icmadophila ericetorum]
MATLTSTPRLRPSMRNLSANSHANMTPTSHRSSGTDDIQVGDAVNVPGGMDGTVKFLGEVKGKAGIFVGVELSRRWAGRGKNDGEAEGWVAASSHFGYTHACLLPVADTRTPRIRYFSTSIPGSGIFLPTNRATKRFSPTTSTGSIPPTPTTPSVDAYSADQGRPDRNPYASPTPSIQSRFSQSVGPGRVASPQGFRPKSRPSLPRPESPLRRTQNINTPLGDKPLDRNGRPSLNMLTQNRLAGPRYAASPTPVDRNNTKTPSKAPAARDRAVANGFSAVGTTPVAKPNGRAPAPRPEPIAPVALKEHIEDNTDEITHLRAITQQQNERIALLTSEFDTHRADFRSTLDTLELASAETERVYEKRVEDLLKEREQLMEQNEDVESVAQQLRQLEEVVAELEEGLEDARRGEAEARGEVEFLRGEVERVRAELRGEREKNAALVMQNINGHGHSHSLSNGISAGVGVDGHRGAYLEPVVLDHSEVDGGGNGSESVGNVTSISTGGGDADKWCALCEGDGHDSISCPFEKA